MINTSTKIFKHKWMGLNHMNLGVSMNRQDSFDSLIIKIGPFFYIREDYSVYIKRFHVLHLTCWILATIFRKGSRHNSSLDGVEVSIGYIRIIACTLNPFEV
jgi:hypothetical protein